MQYYWLGINDSPLKERSSEDLVKAEEARLGTQLDAAEKLAILEREYRELRKEEVTLMEAGAESLAPEKVESQKIIREDELTEHLAKGWAFVASLPSGKVVIKK